MSMSCNLGAPVNVGRVLLRSTALVLLLALVACGAGGGGDNTPPVPVSHEFRVTVTGTGVVSTASGSINCGTLCTATVPHDTVVTLLATPGPGQALLSWGGACAGSTGSSCTVTVTQETAAMATFAAAANFPLGVAVTGNGSVSSLPAGINCGTTCTASFATNTVVTLTATAAQGQVLQSWGGACSGNTACSVTMSEARNVTATFVAAAPNTFALTVVVTGGGSVSSQPIGINCGSVCAVNFAANSMVSLTATPAQGQVLQSWGGACSGTAACSVTMSEARNVTATFTAAPPSALNWIGAALLENSNDFNVAGTGSFADVDALTAIDLNGNALVIWQQSDGIPDGSTQKVFSRRYVAGQGWAAAVVVPGLTGSNQELVNGRLLAHDNGNFTWIRDNFEARRFAATGGWSSEVITPAPVFGLLADASLDPSGNVHVLRGGVGNVWHATLSPTGNQWSTWADAGGASLTLAVTGGIRLAISGTTGIAIWRERNPGDNNDSLWANRMVNNVWQTRQRIEEGLTTVREAPPGLTMDAAGNALAVWHQGNSLFVNRFTAASTSWGAAQEFDAGQLASPVVPRIRLAMNTAGQAVAGWNASLGFRAMTYSPSTGFSSPTTIATAYTARGMGIDTQGNVLAVYNAPGGTSQNPTFPANLHAIELPVGGVWSIPVLLESGAGELKLDIHFAMNPAGQAIVIWVQDDLANNNVRNSLWGNLRR